MSKFVRKSNGVTRIKAFYTDEFESLSRQTLDRDGHQCTKCGRESNSKEGILLRAHHIIPKSRGGQDRLMNLITLCDVCHSKEPGHGHLRKDQAGSRTGSRPKVKYVRKFRS